MLTAIFLDMYIYYLQHQLVSLNIENDTLSPLSHVITESFERMIDLLDRKKHLIREYEYDIYYLMFNMYVSDEEGNIL